MHVINTLDHQNEFLDFDLQKDFFITNAFYYPIIC